MTCFANGTAARLSYVNETVYGTTPSVTAGSTQIADFVRIAFTVNKVSSRDPSIQENGQVKDLTTTDETPTGDATVVYRHEGQDDFLASLFRNDWSSDVLKFGNDDRSMTIWVEQLDNNVDRKYTGMRVNTFSVDVSKGDSTQAVYGFVGNGHDSTPPGDSAPTPKVGKAQMFDFDGTIKEGGQVIGYVTGVSLNINNNLVPAVALGTKSPICYSSSMKDVTGNVTAHFKDAVLLNKFLSDSYSKLEFEIVDADGNSHKWLLPRIKYTGAQIDIGDGGQVPISLDFEATYDDGVGSAVTVTRS